MIPHNKPTLGAEEEQIAQKVIRSGWLSQGKQVEHLENEFCRYLGLSEGHAVAVSSCTAALFLALWLLDSKGKHVAFPAYACSSLRHAVAMVGGIEVPIDSATNCPNMDPSKLDTDEIDLAIVAHLYGLPIDLSSVRDVHIVEDCAQAVGASISGIPVGLQGDLGVFSFSATKLITSGGQGGMVVSKDRGAVDEIRDYREFDCRHDQKTRFNFMMTDLQAAIGRVQLRKLPSFLKRREEIFQHYRSVLPMLDVAIENQSNLYPVRYRAVFMTDTPEQIIRKLASKQIRAIVPIEDWELLGNGSLFPNAHDLTQKTVSLPIYPSLTDENVALVLQQLEQH